MSTRCVVVIQYQMNGDYHVYYHHCDGYPTWIGLRLAEKLREGDPIESIIETLKLKDENRAVRKPENAFPEIQGDLEYIYIIVDNPDPEMRSLQILKTSNLHCDWEKPFTYPVWSSYVKFFPRDLATAMHETERIATITLHALDGFYKAMFPRAKA